MSAPNEGRQSPDPERQMESQQGTETKPNEQGQADSKEQPAEQSKDTLKNLESNPKHVLQDEADKKVEKK
jgi:hypothetical protein